MSLTENKHTKTRQHRSLSRSVGTRVCPCIPDAPRRGWASYPAGRWEGTNAFSSPAPGCGTHPTLPAGVFCCCCCLFEVCFFLFPPNSRKREALGGALLPRLPFRSLLRPGLLWSGAAAQVSAGREPSGTLPGRMTPRAAPRAAFTTNRVSSLGVGLAGLGLRL